MEAYEATLSITEAARALGIHPNTLRKKMDKLGIAYKKKGDVLAVFSRDVTA